MINNAYYIELTSDDGRTHAKFHRYYSHTRTDNWYGKSCWTGFVRTKDENGKDVAIRQISFQKKSVLINWLKMQPEFSQISQLLK